MAGSVVEAECLAEALVGPTTTHTPSPDQSPVLSRAAPRAAHPRTLAFAPFPYGL